MKALRCIRCSAEFVLPRGRHTALCEGCRDVPVIDSYEPTSREIAEACEAFRAGWSDEARPPDSLAECANSSVVALELKNDILNKVQYEFLSRMLRDSNT